MRFCKSENEMEKELSYHIVAALFVCASPHMEICRTRHAGRAVSSGEGHSPARKERFRHHFSGYTDGGDRRNRDGKKAAEPESEIRMDKGRVGDTEVTAVKEEKLARLQQRAVELTSKTAEMSGEATEEIKKERAYTKQVPAEEEA